MKNATQRAFVILRRHRPFVLVFLLAALPLFADLGSDYLWADEGDTAVFASNILKTGVPHAWDGKTFIDSDFGARLNDDLVMVSHPWLQYYITAASFALFGETPFAARLPFAVAGWLTILVVYVLVVRLTDDRRAGTAAALLLTMSVQFLLYSRQSRNYALYMLLGCLVVLLFQRLTSLRRAAGFTVASTLLVHANPAGFSVLAALGLLTLVHAPHAAQRRWFWRSMIVVAALALPWFASARSGLDANTMLASSWTILAPRAAQFLIEWGSVAPAFGVFALLFYVLARHRAQRPEARPRRLFASGERTLLVTIIFVAASCGAMMVLLQSRAAMFNFGLRYAAPLLPLTVTALALLISKASQQHRRVFVALVLLFALTKAGRITPWTFWTGDFIGRSAAVKLHTPLSVANSIFRLAPIVFAQELWQENPGTVAQVSQFLSTRARDNDIVITNYEWAALYFHTRLPQGLKVLPRYPIYETARRHGLPDYVFNGRNARWIVWRWVWDGYGGYNWNQLEGDLTTAGATITRVATVPETAWENRENVHFHRFTGSQYLYPNPHAGVRDAEIFRVDWPNGGTGTGAGGGERSALSAQLSSQPPRLEKPHGLDE